MPALKTLPRLVRLGLILALGGLALSCGGEPVKKDPALVEAARNLASQGSYWFGRGCYGRAERFFFQALETSRLVDDGPGILRALNNLGACALAQGRLEEAGENLKKALDLNQTLSIPGEQSQILGNLAALAFKAGKYPEAEDFWRRAISAAEADEPNRAGLSLHLANLGMLLRTQNRLEEAESILRRAQALATQRKETTILASVHLQLGLLVQAKGHLDLAARHLNVALQLDREAANPRGIAQDLERLGLLYQAKGLWRQAALELDRAILLRAALKERAKVEELFQALEHNRAKSGWPETLAPYERLLGESFRPDESILCQ